MSEIIGFPQKHISSPNRLVRAFESGKKSVIFLGAGASVCSGVPATNELTKLIFQFGYWNENVTKLDYTEIDCNTYKPWLKQTFDWYDESKKNSELYPLAVEHILKVGEDRKKFFEYHLQGPHVMPSIGYSVLVELVQINLVTTILTTNLDNCFSKTLKLFSKPPKIHFIKEVSDINPFVSRQIPSDTPKIIYLHGAIENYNDKNIPEEIHSLNSGLTNYILPSLQDNPIIVIGYRGIEHSIMNGLFLNEKFRNESQRLNFPYGVFWCTYQPNGNFELSPKIKELSENIGTNLVLIPIKGFDNLMSEIIGPNFGINSFVD